MQSEAKAKALEQFTDYFVKNYPGPDTIIYNPNWHAPKIFAAAYSAITATLSDKQAGEVKIKPLEWEGELGTEYAASILGLYSVWEGHYRPPGAHGGIQADNPKQAAQDHLERIIRSALVDVPAAIPTANCCICGRLVDTREKSEGGDDFGDETEAGKWTCSVQCYDAYVGFVPDEVPPLSEGEDSAEVVTLTRAEADRIAQRLEFDASWDKCGDGYYSIKRQLGALAATSSGSATSASGTSAIRQRGESE